jgi:hypothetical protein
MLQLASSFYIETFESSMVRVLARSFFIPETCSTDMSYQDNVCFHPCNHPLEIVGSIFCFMKSLKLS